METAERICKRFHSYLLSGEYTGRVAAITGEKLDIETAFGIVSIVNAGALQPFSCFVSGIQPFTAMNLQPGMDVLLDRKSIDIPDGDFSVDVTLAEDVDLSIECMVNLFLPVDISIRARYIHRIVEQYSANEDLSLLIIDPEGTPELQQMRASLRDLSQAFFEQDLAHIEQAAASCSGFGSGVVPASDALLCGYMACFSCLSYALGRGRERCSASPGLQPPAVHPTPTKAGPSPCCRRGRASWPRTCSSCFGASFPTSPTRPCPPGAIGRLSAATV